MRTFLCFAALSLVVAACATEDNQTTSNSACASKTAWSGGNSESPYMNPGMDCIACHQKEGPKFQIAGTVFGVVHDPDLCEGKSNITVEVVDSLGKGATMTTNEAGNFYLQGGATLTPPYTVQVKYGDKVSAMNMKAPNGQCNSCHTEQGANGAPGRIFIQ